MENTTNLTLPYIMPSQAQKHVTHNEALLMLDAIVQLAVLDRHRTQPPSEPGEGDRHIVASGATGAWEGWSGDIAAFVDGAWARFSPRPGWLAWVQDEELLLVHDGVGWVGTTPAALQDLALLGLGTQADAENPFSAKLNKALWTARYDAEGGDGDLFYTMNKENAGGDVGFLLQTDFVTKALIGLFGSDNLRIAVSQDGSAFNDAVAIDGATGAVGLPGNAKFIAYTNFDNWMAAATPTRVAINNNHYNDQNVFDGGNNRFVAPRDGLYLLGCNMKYVRDGTNDVTVFTGHFLKNGTDIVGGPFASQTSDPLNDGSWPVNASIMVALEEGDYVELWAELLGTQGYVGEDTTFWGSMIA